MIVERIGDAELYLGDCREILPMVSGDMILTDPPYGIMSNHDSLTARWEDVLNKEERPDTRPIQGDTMTEAFGLFKFLLDAGAEAVKPGCVLCTFAGSGCGPVPISAIWAVEILQHPKWDFKTTVIWDKGPIGMGWHYRNSYEAILVAVRKGSRIRWMDSSMRIENILRAGRFRKIIPRRNQHPTEKPWELAAFFISLHTNEGDTVIDPFMGGGSFGEGAIRAGRKFIGIEVDEKFFSMAVERIKNVYLQAKLF